MDAPQSTPAGIITASAAVFTALGGLLLAIGVLLPILRQTRATSAKVNVEAAKTAVNNASVNMQLATIHHLVNSELTAARQAELDLTRLLVAALRRVVTFNEHAGLDTTKEQDEIDLGEGHIKELRALLAERKVEQAKVDEQLLKSPPV